MIYSYRLISSEYCTETNQLIQKWHFKVQDLTHNSETPFDVFIGSIEELREHLNQL